MVGFYEMRGATLTNTSDNYQIRQKKVTIPNYEPSDYSRNQVPGGQSKKYIYRVNMLGYQPAIALWHISPEGCIRSITVNYAPVDLKKFGNMCNSGGYDLDLRKYLKSGGNLVDITLEDVNGEKYGINLWPVRYMPWFGYIDEYFNNIIFTLAICAVCMTLSRLGFDGWAIAIACASTYVYINVFMYRNNVKLTPDYWGHIPYIRHMAYNWLPPPSYDGWENYHPPFYYFIAGIASRIAMYYGRGDMHGARIVAFVSLMFYNLFGMLIIREIVTSKPIQRICFCILLFWPFINCMVGRLSNESLTYAFWAPIYYYLLLWMKRKNSKYLAVSLVLCGMTMLCKTSALVPAGAIGACVLIELFLRKVSLKACLTKDIIKSGLFLCTCTLLVFGRTYYYKVTHNPNMDLLISNMYMDPFMRYIYSPATWGMMTTFSFTNLIDYPYVTIFNDTQGRHLFWNTYVRTSLTGFHEFPNGWLGSRVAICEALLIMYSWTAALYVRPAGVEFRFLTISYFIGISAQVINRIINPSVGLADARTTYPIFILLFAWAGYVVQTQLVKRRYFTGIIGLILLLAMASMSIRFDLLYIDHFTLAKFFF